MDLPSCLRTWFYSPSLVPPSYYLMSRKHPFEQFAARHKPRMGCLTESLHNCHRRWILSGNRLPDRLESQVRYKVYDSGLSGIWLKALPLAPLTLSPCVIRRAVQAFHPLQASTSWKLFSTLLKELPLLA